MRKGILAAAVLLALVAPAGTLGAFHLVKISEVGDAGPADYVELQMHAEGQNLTGTHYIRTYDAAGAVWGTFQFPGNAASGENQRTILTVRDDGAFPVTPDFLAPPDDLIIASQGAVCFLESIAPVSAIDCVSFGAFAGVPGGDPSPMGTPAPVLPPGSALVRSIAPGCPTQLEASDDTDDSNADFALGPPSPRNNATAPTETACVVPDTDPPETTIDKKPKKRSTKSRAKFKFSSDEPGTFECKLDRSAFEPCSSPFRKRVGIGKHRFQVAAIDRAGNRDGSPAKARFRRLAAD